MRINNTQNTTVFSEIMSLQELYMLLRIDLDPTIHGIDREMKYISFGVCMRSYIF